MKGDLMNLHVINTDRFKTISLCVDIRFENKREYFKYLPFLCKMLLMTSSKYDSLRDINIACASIYDPTYMIRIIPSGKQNILTLSGKFSNEKYTEKGMNEKNIKFLLEFLFKPKVIDNAFDNEIFEVQKSKVIDYYKSIKDNPRNYADFRSDEYINGRGYQEPGVEEIIREIEKVTSEDLYNFYKEIMDNGVIDVFVCGEVIEDDIKRIIENNITFKNNKKLNHIIYQDKCEDLGQIIESSNNAQSNLIIGFKALNLTEFERKYVFTLYSWILGGYTNSLLHQSVREKNSLCYYIYAARTNLQCTMKIYAGINASSFDKCLKLIDEEMINVEKGNFSSELFEGVKEIYYNSLIKIEDDQGDLINSYASEIFTNSDSIEDRRKNMEKVTKEDVMNLAKKVKKCMTYLLKGERENG